QDLTAHPLSAQLQACDSPAAILTILQDQVDRVLYAFSVTLGEGVGLVSVSCHVKAKDVYASQDLLVDIFEHIEKFFRQLEIYTKVTPTPAMTDAMVEIMVEVLNILATATKEMKQSSKKFSEEGSRRRI
ncbi:hypothetical protein EDB85DRAFT_1996116, partial [Lactarius pseudohatsudake]